MLRDKLDSEDVEPLSFEALAKLYDRYTFEGEQEAPVVPLWPMLFFCWGGTMCLLCSASYHLGRWHAPTVDFYNFKYVVPFRHLFVLL
jgi:predicted membrane channel-forming protein YqfA (hemolysin III family)